jgi:hypothetical protein
MNEKQKPFAGYVTEPETVPPEPVPIAQPVSTPVDEHTPFREYAPEAETASGPATAKYGTSKPYRIVVRGDVRRPPAADTSHSGDRE